MSIFDRLRRNRQQSVLPDEVQQYYQAEQKQRRGRAFLLALGALLVTVLVAAALFIGGRALYSQIRGDKDDNKPNASNIEDNSQEKQNQDAASENGAPTEGGSAPETQTPAPAANPAPTPTPAPAPTTTPALGDTPALPHTGDPGM